MTTVFEVHFTNPTDFLEELQADAAQGEAGAVQDRILRVALRKKPATAGQARGRRYHNEADDLPAPMWNATFVEASYISRRQQLVKLSAYCGCIYLGPMDEGLQLAGLPLYAFNATAATQLQQQQTVRLVMATGTRLGLECRGGGLYVEEGAWVASPDDPIAAPADEACATCAQPIYYANEQWRHKDDADLQAFENVRVRAGRAEALGDLVCSLCGGTGNRTQAGRPRRCNRCMGQGKLANAGLHHLADPDQEGRTV